MDKKVALIGIILKNRGSVQELNSILTEYGDYIIGRMGIPHIEKSVNVISIAMIAPQNIVEELSDKIRGLEDITAETIYKSL